MLLKLSSSDKTISSSRALLKTKFGKGKRHENKRNATREKQKKDSGNYRKKNKPFKFSNEKYINLYLPS